MSDTLSAFSSGQLSLTNLAQQWRQAAQSHQPALPARYLEVLERVLSQLESSALFTEESCSFSQSDMVAALADWLARARALPH
ncbi:MAG: hypothetical protein KGI91_07120 [Burkholderiales bacterium]|nr:hypothetical protein [Burkholderiales bacterium]MDE2076828.1 hypothetical protein [Burkholderiales bacterium]MDE2433427.1 hypothetical protein [Burkholderiales bacterium]